MSKGTVALITGVGSGIGAATAALARERGFTVVGIDRTEPEPGLVDYFHAGDVTSEADNHAAVALAQTHLGGVDIAVLNVGAPASGYLEELPLQEYQDALDVNTTSVVLGMRAVIPVMRSAAGDAFVATASNCAFGGDPHRWAYSAAKAAVLSIVASASLEFADSGIRINAVCPGPIATGITRQVRENMPQKSAQVTSGIPMGRWGQPHEVAAAILFLASPEASFITGVALPVDGGATSMGPNYAPTLGLK